MKAADETTDVVIVGAGGGGAVLGLALARKGIRSIVLEQASGPARGLRGEILQPNGQQILDRLGVLKSLPSDAVREVRLFHFYWAGGTRLCTVDYGELAPPYNRALVTLPNAAHHAIVNALRSANPTGVRYGTRFTGLTREGDRVTGVTVDYGGRRGAIRAKLVVGADGMFSKVREALGIPAAIHRYDEAYLIAVVPGASGLDEARYFVGKNQILGVFPSAGGQAYAFYMIPSGSYERVKQAGLDALKRRWREIDPHIEPVTENLRDWDQTGYMPTGRVRTPRWVADGAVLIGDAAHAMNPHASQGRMQAMADAVALAEVIGECSATDRWQAQELSRFERMRRPQVEMLQQLADEQVMFWNTGNPLLAMLRDRVFRTLDRNARLRYQVLTTTAGWRQTRPFSLVDRVMAAGMLPDPKADLVSRGAGE